MTSRCVRFPRVGSWCPTKKRWRRGLRMRNHVKPKAERIEPEHGLCTEATSLFGPEEKDYDSEEEGFDLQCGESLSIAINRVGEEGSGIKLLLGGLEILKGCGSFRCDVV